MYMTPKEGSEYELAYELAHAHCKYGNRVRNLRIFYADGTGTTAPTRGVISYAQVDSEGAAEYHAIVFKQDGEEWTPERDTV